MSFSRQLMAGMQQAAQIAVLESSYTVLVTLELAIFSR